MIMLGRFFLAVVSCMHAVEAINCSTVPCRPRTQRFQPPTTEVLAGALEIWCQDSETGKPNAIAQYGFVNGWDVSLITDLSGTATNPLIQCNPQVYNWDTSRVTTMEFLFSNFFNNDISSWNTSKVTSMRGCFNGARKFNQSIGGLDVGQVQDFSGMFEQALEFDVDLGEWNMESATNTSRMFKFAKFFNRDISSWKLKSSDVEGMFDNAITFNQPLNAWDVSKAMNMDFMFRKAQSFNQPLNKWKVGTVTSMKGMFNDATLFNGDVSSWNTAASQNMFNMFASTSMDLQKTAFWNTSSVTSPFGGLSQHPCPRGVDARVRNNNKAVTKGSVFDRCIFVDFCVSSGNTINTDYSPACSNNGVCRSYDAELEENRLVCECVPGFAGVTCAGGEPGPQGEKGEAGPQGPRGKKGEMGPAGKDGEDVDPELLVFLQNNISIAKDERRDLQLAIIGQQLVIDEYNTTINGLKAVIDGQQATIDTLMAQFDALIDKLAPTGQKCAVDFRKSSNNFLFKTFKKSAGVGAGGKACRILRNTADGCSYAVEYRTVPKSLRFGDTQTNFGGYPWKRSEGVCFDNKNDAINELRILIGDDMCFGFPCL